jgi:RimJ/RimL family protein N-acetyltransferase
VQGPFAIDADVLEHNAASRRLFLSAHYAGEGTAFSKQFRGSEMPHQPQPKVRSWS